MSILTHVGSIGAVVLAGTLVACAGSRQGTEVEEAGFLGEYYGLLGPGDPERYEAIRRYVAPDVDAASYDKVIVDPVTAWADPEQVDTEGLQLADVQELADYLHAVLRDELDDDFELVSEPQPNTLRVQVALTSAAPSNQTMVVVSNVLPIAVAVTQAREYVTGRPTYQGEASVEYRILDAEDGELLAAGVDRRIGGRTLYSAKSSWADVENIGLYWARQLRYRLCREQNREGCTPPQAHAVRS
jgi:Protein of unknown function (DUF3313)